MTNFLNDNQGLWGFLAVPLAFAALLVPLWQILRTAATSRMSEHERLRALITAMTRDRSLALLHRRGVFRLPVRLVDAKGQGVPDPATVMVAHLAGGGCAEIVGEAGAGKSYLAVGVRMATLHQDSQVLVDVVSARELVTSASVAKRGSGNAELTKKASVVLQRRYRSFRRSYLRRLLDQGQVILAIDGFDEIDETQAEQLWKSILEHASTLPVLVLRRSGTEPSGVTAKRLSFYQFARYEVRALGELAVARLLRERYAWYPRLSEARRPRELRRMLTNPLRLQLALQTWSRDKPPDDVLASEDPSATLWAGFLRERLDGPTSGEPDRQLRRVAQVLSLCSEHQSLRLSDAYFNTRIRGWVMAILAVAFVPLSWMIGNPSAVLALLVAMWGALQQGTPSRLLGVPLRSVLERSTVAYAVCVAVLFGAAYLAFYYFFKVVQAFVVVIEAAMDHGHVGVIDAWNGYLILDGVEEVLADASWMRPPSPFLIAFFAFGLMFIFTRDLRSVRNDVLHVLPGWSWTPFRDHLWPRAVVGVACLYVSLTVTPTLLPFGLFLLSSALYGLFQYVGMAIYVGSARCCSRDTLRRLEEVGIVYRHGRWLRFVHQEIADHIADEVIRQPDGLAEHTRMIPSYRAWTLLTNVTGHEDVPVAEPFARALLRRHRDDGVMISVVSLLLTYGISDLRAAERAQSRLSSGEIGSHLAETLWFTGEIAQARRVMARTVRRFPNNVFVLHKSSRMLITQGRHEEGLGVLRSALDQVSGADRLGLQTLIALWESQLGLVEVRDVLDRLDDLAIAANPLSDEAILEAARLYSEELGEHSRAVEELERIDTSEEWGVLRCRLAQVRVRQGLLSQAAELANFIMRDVSWGEEPMLQLEAAVTAGAVTGDAVAERLIDRMEGYGWPMTDRLRAIGRDMRVLRDFRQDESSMTSTELP